MAKRFCAIFLLTFFSFNGLNNAQFTTIEGGKCQIRSWRYLKYTDPRSKWTTMSSEEQCILLCWQRNQQGYACKAVNYFENTWRCELLPIAFTDKYSNGTMLYDQTSNYSEPISCTTAWFGSITRSTPVPRPERPITGGTIPWFVTTARPGGTIPWWYPITIPPVVEVATAAPDVVADNNTYIRPGSCGQSSVPQRARMNRFGQRIVGGNEARQNSIPFIVSLRMYGSHFCGGTLVRVSPNREESDIVITAAHCMSNTNFDVVAGAHYRNRATNGEQKVGAEKVVTHPNYNSPVRTNNDIAVVKLKQPIKFSQTVQPACLPSSKSEGPADNVNGIVAGWGTTRESGSLSDALMQVVVPVVGTTKCKQSYSTLVADTMMCAGYDQGQKDSCQGDSGGPYFFEGKQGYTLQGIVSFGAGCARPRYPGIYSRVTNYVDWIQMQIKSLSLIRA